MPKHAPIVLLLGFLLSASSSFAQESSAKPPIKNDALLTPPAAKDAPDVWQTVTVKDGNFSVIFPATAKREGSRSRIQNSDSNGVETRFTTEIAGGTYQVAYTFLSENVATPQSMRQRFDSLLKSLKNHPRAKWLSGGDIEYKGNPGIELKVLLVENNTVTWSRQYFAFGCIYEITARYPLTDPEPKQPQLFLESFNLLGPPTQRPVLAAQKETLPDFTPISQTIYYVSAETLRKQALQPVEPDFSKKAPFWEIRLRVTVSPEGKVVEVDAVDNYSSLHDDAIKAARKWSFKPFMHGGKAVSVQGNLIFKSSTMK